MLKETTFGDDADKSISSPVDFPVPASPILVEAKASVRKKRQRKHPACSGNSCESSETSDPVGSLLRACLLSELGVGMSCSVQWRNTGTPAGHSWLVASISGRRTAETESGSSRDWPTLTASAVQNRSGRYAGGNLTLEGLVRQLAAGQPGPENGNMTGNIQG